ncbi:MAG: Uma2 family endonuclease [Armatimonadetes bacterium]|nr:Uma2 family endonuclease [Armatimonadota bacterium]
MTTALVQPPLGRVTSGRATTRDFHWTVETFDRAVDMGVFREPKRLELIHGRIVEKMPQSSLHANVVEFCASCLRSAMAPRFRVREEKPIHIAFDGEPVPDVALVRGQLLDSHQPLPQPADVVLLVEVAVSSVDNDLGEKALLYAEAGIEDYWTVVVEEGVVLVHRDPTPQGYASVATLGAGQTVSPLAAQGVTLAVGDLLGVSG